MKSTDTIHIRSADQKAASFLVPLMAESSGGAGPAICKARANEGESIEASGTRYLSDPANDLRVRNTIVVVSQGVRPGAMTSHQEGRIPPTGANSRDHSPLPVALAAALLSCREPGDPDSVFIAEICFLPQARGQGSGTRFLQYANDLAIEMGLPGVTLRVYSTNVGAVRLYERSGFHLVDKRPVIPRPDIKITGFVYLMPCPV